MMFFRLIFKRFLGNSTVRLTKFWNCSKKKSMGSEKMKEYEVRIPKEFKWELERRFNIKNIKEVDGQYTLKNKCPLCISFLANRCNGCPFKRFEGFFKGGCIVWMKRLGIQLFGLESWPKEDMETMKAEIRKLKRMANKYIEWV